MKALVFLLSLSAISLLASARLPSELSDTSESGIVLSRIGRTLILVDRDDKTNRMFEIPASVRIILDGEPAKLENLEAGDHVVLTLTPERKVTKVEARSGKAKFAPSLSPTSAADAARD